MRDGDDWVINGSKVFTSLAEYADYIWLAARTDPDATKHDGISIFMVPTPSPGFKITPIRTMGDVPTNATYYEDVRVPANALVGPENDGWWLIVDQLNHERIVADARRARRERFYEETRDWARETRLPDGRRVIDQPWVQHEPGARARRRRGAEAAQLAPGVEHGARRDELRRGVDGEGLRQRVLRRGLPPAARGARPGGLREGAARPRRVLQGRLERMYRATLILTFGGGTNEVQRDIIAMAGLGMPRSR